MSFLLTRDHHGSSLLELELLGMGREREKGGEVFSINFCQRLPLLWLGFFPWAEEDREKGLFISLSVVLFLFQCPVTFPIFSLFALRLLTFFFSSLGEIFHFDLSGFLTVETFFLGVSLP